MLGSTRQQENIKTCHLSSFCTLLSISFFLLHFSHPFHTSFNLTFDLTSFLLSHSPFIPPKHHIPHPTHCLTKQNDNSPQRYYNILKPEQWQNISGQEPSLGYRARFQSCQIVALVCFYHTNTCFHTMNQLYLLYLKIKVNLQRQILRLQPTRFWLRIHLCLIFPHYLVICSMILKKHLDIFFCMCVYLKIQKLHIFSLLFQRPKRK